MTAPAPQVPFRKAPCRQRCLPNWTGDHLNPNIADKAPGNPVVEFSIQSIPQYQMITKVRSWGQWRPPSTVQAEWRTCSSMFTLRGAMSAARIGGRGALHCNVDVGGTATGMIP